MKPPVTTAPEIDPDNPGEIGNSDNGSNSPLAIATALTKRGYTTIPIPYRCKKPVIKKWQKLRLATGDLHRYFDGKAMNIGVLLGEPSGGLVDVDLDSSIAQRLAPLFLPMTSAVFGRASSPASHWLYFVEGESVRIETWEDHDGEMIVELRGTGHQTVFPGSTHPSGEAIRFDRDGAPLRTDLGKLVEALSKLAAASILAKHWPNVGSRHEAALALAGVLLRAKWSCQQAEAFIEAVAVGANDDELKDRVQCVESTHRKLEAGEPVKALPALGELLGDHVLKKVVKWLERKPQPSGDRSSEGEPDYFVNSQGTWWRKPTREGPVPVLLANFVATLTADIREDDGAEERRRFELDVVLADGARVNVSVTTDDLQTMTWPLKTLGFRAIVLPGSTTAAHLRVAIQSLSRDVLIRTVYTHTGWAQIGDARAYIHAGGAIGQCGQIPDVQTHLEGGLEHFSLPAPPEREDREVAMAAAMDLLELGPHRLTYPLLASVARAILGGADFSIFLVGRTGTFKSEVASLFQRFFGLGFDARHLPGSWSSTGNALEESAFRVKDAIFVVDDFKPAGDASDAKLHQQADRLLRAQGNGTGRQRMRPDCSLRAARPPRGLILSTGEELPAGESLRARLIPLEFADGDIKADTLTRYQSVAARGLYAAATAAFVRWCASRLDDLRAWFRSRVEELRLAYLGGHARSAIAMAELEAAFEIFVKCVVESTAEVVLTAEQATVQLANCRRALLETVASQSAEILAADPVKRYLELLGSALGSGQAHVATREGMAPPSAAGWGWRPDPDNPNIWRPQGVRIGWIDGSELYLDSDASYRIARSASIGGEGVSIGVNSLRKRLKERGLLVTSDSGRQSCSRRVEIEGRRRPVLHLQALAIAGHADQSDAKGSQS